MPTVREIMQKDVVTVLPDISVLELSRVLSEQGISGVPVVNQAGLVLGVVSGSDVVRLAAEQAGIHLADAQPFGSVSAPAAEVTTADDEEETEPYQEARSYFLPEESPTVDAEWEAKLGVGSFDGFRVEDIMTPVSFSIGPDATVKELADFLARGRIHRAVVTEGSHLLGIVTTMDVLRSVAGDT